LIITAIGIGSLSGDDGSQERDPVASEPVATTSPLDFCIDDTIALINEHATASNQGDDYVLYRRYGMEDPRTQPLGALYFTFQAETIRLGQAEAETNLFQGVGEWCDEFGPDG